MESAFCWTLHANPICKFQSCIPSAKNNLWLRSPCFLPVMASEKSQGINVPQVHSQPPSGKSWCINTPVPLAMKGRNSEVFVLVCLPEFP